MSDYVYSRQSRSKKYSGASKPVGITVNGISVDDLDDNYDSYRNSRRRRDCFLPVSRKWAKNCPKFLLKVKLLSAKGAHTLRNNFERLSRSPQTRCRCSKDLFLLKITKDITSEQLLCKLQVFAAYRATQSDN